MIYAFREYTHSRVLVEFRSAKEMRDYDAANAARDGGAEPPFTHTQTTRERAHAWVKAGNIHETGLWVDQGRVRYALPGY